MSTASDPSVLSRDAAKGPQRVRDPRLDFFRGACMFIIFIAHVPGNTWQYVIPARFGFSDATEVFVFCSGMASASAFGRLFDTAGFWLASARVAQRVWQVYWSHVGVFLASVLVLIAADKLLCTDGHIRAASSLNEFLSRDPGQALFGYLTLTYLPPRFDILPMYIVILVMMPLVMAMARLHLAAVAAFVVGVWAIGVTGHLQLPGDPRTGDTWFFHPFGWQLIFFTGFGVMRGWLPTPPVERRFVWLAVAIVIVSFPLAWWPLIDSSPALTQLRTAIAPLIDKNLFGPLRYVHFLAVAYLAYVAAGEGGSRLSGPLAAIVVKVGQQTLAVFMTGMVLAMIGGIILDEAGRNVVTIALVNVAGLALLVVTALVVGWFKSAPWQMRQLRDDGAAARSGSAASGLIRRTSATIGTD
jgi:hypothetical protein